MGWNELRGWLRVMNKQQRGPEPDPHTWAGSEQDDFWEEARRKREQRRGRAG